MLDAVVRQASSVLELLVTKVQPLVLHRGSFRRLDPRFQLLHKFVGIHLEGVDLAPPGPNPHHHWIEVDGVPVPNPGPGQRLFVTEGNALEGQALLVHGQALLGLDLVLAFGDAGSGNDRQRKPHTGGLAANINGPLALARILVGVLLFPSPHYVVVESHQLPLSRHRQLGSLFHVPANVDESGGVGPQGAEIPLVGGLYPRAPVIVFLQVFRDSAPRGSRGIEPQIPGLIRALVIDHPRRVAPRAGERIVFQHSAIDPLRIVVPEDPELGGLLSLVDRVALHDPHALVIIGCVSGKIVLLFADPGGHLVRRGVELGSYREGFVATPHC
mmetsp:Transcript_4905/g.14169  ORF Transcript_4905/g.14169 Transcript_4905/m.14169 type:complete len:329 (+) Transcript_4905:3809-4795(+)